MDREQCRIRFHHQLNVNSLAKFTSFEMLLISFFIYIFIRIFSPELDEIEMRYNFWPLIVEKY